MFLIFLTSFLNGQKDYYKVSLKEIASLYIDKNYERNNIIGNYEKLAFTKPGNFNFGLTYHDHWLKLSLHNKTNDFCTYHLAFTSIMTDTLILYKFDANKLVETITEGEAIPFKFKKTKLRKPHFQIQLKSHESADFLILAPGTGDPMNLNGFLFTDASYINYEINSTLINGFTFGMLIVIWLLNLIYFLVTKEKIYFYFLFQVFFSTMCLLYFEGYLHKYLMPNSSLYWRHQFIAVSLCLTFIFNNLYLDEIFNFKKISLGISKLNFGLIFITIFVLIISFYHPIGFQFFIRFSIVITSIIALLLLFGIYTIRENKNAFYFLVGLATLTLLIVGTTFQFYISGLLPHNNFTQYSMHLAVVFQSILLILAVNYRFREIREQNDDYKIQLIESMNQYSQNLISNIETERQRLATEIHDGLGQNLLVIRNRILQALKKEDINSKINTTLEGLLDVTTDALNEARAMSHDLRPPILNTMGLTIAIKSLVEKVEHSSGLKIELDFPQSIDGTIKKELEINVYRILQECFANVLKHAGAKEISISIIQKNNFLDITFEDNGKGFEIENKVYGQGLLGMKERVFLLNGTIEIESVSEKKGLKSGTIINIKIPIK